ncbi:hypothetical protein OIE75_24095 [Streptomyces sp. NBC_01723]|uniref:hypothetical protein n=1 Tax=unclassified Streptomyces TaxID=2593676 RepID=UPI002789E182|nr:MULTISPECIES: hypothetical protein [unclassified Streptomyces]MDQ0406053.1 hypothetical protein [Streptomyces sp. DSM 40167]
MTASRMPGTPHSAVVLQRAIGNQAYSQVVQRAPASGGPAAPEGAKIGLTLSAVKERFEALKVEEPELAKQQEARWNKLLYVLQEFDNWMRSIEVGYRFGGSLIAYIYGGARAPQDIDIEVSNGDNMHRLLTEMKGSGAWSGQLGEQGNQLLSIYCKNARVPEFQFDVSSETQGFNTPFELKESMQVEGDAVVSGDKVSRDELILNYLDRMIQKPDVARSKGDDDQIAGLLRAAGCRTPAHVEAYWGRNLQPAIKAGDSRIPALRDNLASIATEKFAPEAQAPRGASPEPMEVDGDEMDLS